MDLIIAVAIGCLVGWGAFRFSQASTDQGLRACLLLGGVGGGLGNEISSLFGWAARTDGHFNIAWLVVPVAVAVACLMASTMIARRSNG